MITLADVQASKLLLTSRGTGSNFFFYQYTNVQYPRLSRFDQYLKTTRSVESTWQVDGQAVVNLEVAIELLNIPPTVTSEELDLWDEVPTEWTLVEDRAEKYARWYSLKVKGLIEWKNKRVRKVP